MNFINNIIEYFKSLKIEELIKTRVLDPLTTFVQAEGSADFLRNLIYFAVILCACGILVRLFLGKSSGFAQAMAACQSIQFTYLMVIALYLLLPALRTQIFPLPFLSVTSEQYQLWELMVAPNEVLTDGIFRLAVLSLIVNLLEDNLPKAKKLIPWLLWRGVSALLSIAVYSFLLMVLDAAFADVPSWIGPVVVLILWSFVILVGIIRGLMNIALASVPKVLESVYTFFYSRDKKKEKDKEVDKGPGKVLTKSIFSAIAFLVVVLILNRQSIGVFMFAELSLFSFLVATVVVLVTMNLFVHIF